MRLPDKWLKRDSEIKTKLVQILADSISNLTDKNLISGLNRWLTTQDEAMKAAVTQKNYLKISNLFETELGITDLLGIAEFLNINIQTTLGFEPGNVDGATIDYNSLNDYIHNSTGLSAAVCVTTPLTQETMSSPNIDASRTFSIHSVGKVFTGVLMLKMLQAGVISEDILNKPPNLGEKVLEKLSPDICVKLKQCILSDLMLHKSGLGNYLEEFVAAIKAGRDLSNVNAPIDFLQFAEKNIYPLDQVDHISGEKIHYSNLGILLVGLAIEHAYSEHFGITKSYNDILYEYIINADTGGAGLSSFSLCNPGNGNTNPTDNIAPHMRGSPDGGYWITAGDLGKFGSWLVKQSQDTEFKMLLKKYGAEFYDKNRNVIAHSGGIPSASAYLTCYLDTETAVAILSNRPWQAIGLYKFIEAQEAKV